MKAILGLGSGRRISAICVFLAAATLSGGRSVSAQTPAEALPKENPATPFNSLADVKGQSVTDPSSLDPWQHRANSTAGGTDEPVVSDAAFRGFYPRVGTISSRSAVGAGAGYRDERLFGGPIGIDASALFSYPRSAGYQVLVGLLDRRPGGVALAPADSRPTAIFDEASENERGGVAVHGDFRYRNFTRQFYGGGPDRGRQDRSDVPLQGTSYDLVAQYQPAHVFGLTARAGLLDLTSAAGQDAAASVETAVEAPGLSDRSRFLVVGVGGAIDTRTSNSDPHGGIFAGFAAWRFIARSGEASAFTRFAVDVRSYWTPFVRRGVLAVRVLVSGDWTAPGGQVPFSLQQSLGGGETLRGFGTDRFRDLALGYATAEYRFQMNRFLDVGPFVDLGAVGPALSRLSLPSLLKTYGLRTGVRYRSRVLLHLDLGRSPVGYRLTAGAGVLF